MFVHVYPAINNEDDEIENVIPIMVKHVFWTWIVRDLSDQYWLANKIKRQINGLRSEIIWHFQDDYQTMAVHDAERAF